MFTILCRIDRNGQYYNLLPDVCISDILPYKGRVFISSDKPGCYCKTNFSKMPNILGRNERRFSSNRCCDILSQNLNSKITIYQYSSVVLTIYQYFFVVLTIYQYSSVVLRKGPYLRNPGLHIHQLRSKYIKINYMYMIKE